MEGLLDFVLRDVLTRFGGIDRCVSEFIRVTNTLLPPRAFYRIVPELLHGGRTQAGVPVRAQLLGSDPVCLAENAARLAGLGPAGIDLNFGCPAKVVNRHGGGAALLDEPELISRIVSAVRRAVPATMPVSAKMRLGVRDDSAAVECALAMAEAGADEIVVHARTKADGYRPPAYWRRINDIRLAVQVPVVANGEIWNVADASRCQSLSGCSALMLGRGMVTDPGLARAIRVANGFPYGFTATVSCSSQPKAVLPDGAAERLDPALAWVALQPSLLVFWQLVCARLERRQQAGRLKQWLNFLRRRFPEAEPAYQAICRMNDPRQIDAWFASQTMQDQPFNQRPAASPHSSFSRDSLPQLVR